MMFNYISVLWDSTQMIPSSAISNMTYMNHSIMNPAPHEGHSIDCQKLTASTAEWLKPHWQTRDSGVIFSQFPY